MYVCLRLVLCLLSYAWMFCNCIFGMNRNYRGSPCSNRQLCCTAVGQLGCPVWGRCHLLTCEAATSHYHCMVTHSSILMRTKKKSSFQTLLENKYVHCCTQVLRYPHDSIVQLSNMASHLHGKICYGSGS